MGWNLGGGVVFTTTSIFEIEKGLAAFRETIKGLTREKLLDIYAEDAVHWIDDACASGKPLPERVYARSYRQVMDAQEEIRKTRHRNPRYDFDFEISIMPYGRRVYGLVRCEHEAWRKQFMETGLVESFYWFDDECPTDLTNRVWNRRGKVWMGILEEDSRPVAHGFNAELTTPTYLVERIAPADIVARVAPFDKRLNRVAKNVIIHKRMELDEKWIEARAKAKENDKPPEISDFSGAMFRATDWLKTDHGQVALELEKAATAKLLPPVITEDML